MPWWTRAVLVGSLLVSGCTAAATPSAVGNAVQRSTEPSPSASVVDAVPTAPPTPPVDPTIEPVSASHPSPEAEQALVACGATDLGLDHVASMGLVPHGRRAVDYARLSASALFLASDDPAWIVQFRGPVDHLMIGQAWVDQTCVVINGTPQFFATGPVVDLATGKLVRSYWPGSPVKSLPPLAP